MPPWGPPLSRDRHEVVLAQPLFGETLDEYRRRGVTHIVASSYVADRWLLDPESDAQRRAFFARLAKEAELVAEFRPFAGDERPGFVHDQIYGPFNDLGRVLRPGPTLRIYALGPHEAGG